VIQALDARVAKDRGSKMVDLVISFGALVAALVASYFIGKKKKREGLASMLKQPESVARLYLRAAPEIDAYWLHAEFKTGKKACIAAPWEIVDTLKRLEVLGLKLSPEDQIALDGVVAKQSERITNDRVGTDRCTRQTEVKGSALA